MKWITAADIDSWTAKDPRKAQEIIPCLVWKLILASCRSIKDHHFPYGKAIQYRDEAKRERTEELKGYY